MEIQNANILASNRSVECRPQSHPYSHLREACRKKRKKKNPSHIRFYYKNKIRVQVCISSILDSQVQLVELRSYQFMIYEVLETSGHLIFYFCE